MIQAVSDTRHFTNVASPVAVRNQLGPMPYLPSAQQVDGYLQSLNTPSIIKRADSIRHLFPNKRIVFCRDTHIVNVVSNLAAFTNVLANHHSDIVLIQVCTTDVPTNELAAVPELVRQINQLYGTTECVPIHFYHQDVDHEEQIALMTASNVGVLLGSHASTAAIAQEFVVCQHHHYYAPLILSHNSVFGTEEHIISTDEGVSAVTNALEKALNMSSTDAQRRHEVFYRTSLIIALIFI